MTIVQLPPQDIDHGESIPSTLLNWISDFILQPHPDLRRDGLVCPFVGPAMRQETLVSQTRSLDRPPTVDYLVELLKQGVDEFDETDWAGLNPTLQAMLLLLPELTDDEALLLDDAHARIKDELVDRYVMLAPFHPLCTESAARNPQFLAFRSPVPMVAIRNMAFHDIFFLTEKREWFHRYAERFGARYRRPSRLDPIMVERYRAAVNIFGDV